MGLSSWTARLVLAALATVALSQTTTNSGWTLQELENPGLRSLEQCDIIPTGNDQVYQSGESADIFYIISQDYYDAGEQDIFAWNVTSCSYLTLPVADYLTQLQLSESCIGSSRTTTTGRAGRRRLSRYIEALGYSLEQSQLTGQSFPETFEHRGRQLTQVAGTTTNSGGSLSSSLASAPAALLAMGGTNSPAPSPGASSLAGDFCSPEFNTLLSNITLGQSTLASNVLYFIEADVNGNGGLGFCMADTLACGIACLNTARFWDATDTDFAAMCQLAGLS